MEDDIRFWQRPRFWSIVIAIVILLITLYFYDPFTVYIVAGVRNIRFSNIIFWFASLVAVLGFALAHWSAFRRNIFHVNGPANVDGLVFDSLQISLLTAVIFCAGGTLQAVEILSEHLLSRGDIIDPTFGVKVLAIIVLVVLTLIFYLLHMLIKLFRRGSTQRRPGGRSRRTAPTVTRSASDSGEAASGAVS